MVNTIPSSAQVKAALDALSRQDLLRLASVSGVPFHTLQKIKRGETLSPQLETVRSFWPLIGSKQASKQPVRQAA